jgi:hypothetical protein
MQWRDSPLYGNSEPEAKKAMNIDMKDIFVPITKVDAQKHEVWGYGVIEQPDAANEILDYESSKPEFIKWSDAAQARSGGKSLGNLRAMHQTKAAGKLISFQPNDTNKGIFVGAKIVDEEEWKKVEEGVYTGFSVGGSYLRRWSDMKPGYTRYTAKPVELSLVDAPCIPGATFEIVKSESVIQNVPFKPQDAQPTKLVWEPDDSVDLGIPSPKVAETQTLPGNLEHSVDISRLEPPSKTVVIPDSVSKDSSKVPSTETLTQAAVASKEITNPLTDMALVGRLNKFVDNLPETLEAIVDRQIQDVLSDTIEAIVRKAVSDMQASKTRYVKVVKKD